MAVYRNIQVPIPSSRVTIERQSGGRPALIKYVLEAPYNRDKGYPQPKRTTIGHQCLGSRTLMNPTTQYKEIFPQEWAKVSNEKVLPSLKRFGLFAACQALNSRNGIKDILDEVYGVDKASAVIDYALYSILHHSDVTQMFADKMRNETLYSAKAYSDSYYATLFESGMTREQELLFKKKWALRCKEDGVESVWLCVDGSNDDCRSKGVELAEKGHAKSGQNVNLVSFTYAVTTEGRPITWDVYQGSLVDAKAMKRVIDFLDSCGIQVNGVILDRGYCDSKALQYLSSKNLSYLIMIKGCPEGYHNVVSTYGNTIKMNAQYLIPGTCLFGVQQSGYLFKSSKNKDYINLFFDYQNGSERITTMLKNLYKAMEEATRQAGRGEKPVIETRFRAFLDLSEIQEKGEVAWKISINTENLQEAIDSKGLYGIVCSDAIEPSEVHRLYASRNASETQFMCIKTQLGYGKVRVQNTASVRSKFAEGFVASVIRHEMVQAAKRVDKTVNQMIQEADRLEMQKLNEIYTYTHTETDRMKDFLKNLGEKDVTHLIDDCVKYENDRLAGRTPTPRHRKTGPKKGSHRKEKEANEKNISRKPGVKVGTKRPDVNVDGTSRKKPGVKAGTIRGKYNKDGSLRKKPGPKPGSHHSEAISGKN